MSIIINKLHTNNIENEYNYYSIRILKDINNIDSDNEIISMNNEYLYSLAETPNIQKLSKNKIINYSDYYRMKLMSVNEELLNSIINLIIKTLINIVNIEIYKFSFKNKCYYKLTNENIINPYTLVDNYIIKSKFINMYSFYQIIYSISKKSKLDIIMMIDKNNAYKLDLNNDPIKCTRKRIYNINDYKNIGNEYHNICNAYINDMRSELYLKD